MEHKNTYEHHRTIFERDYEYQNRYLTRYTQTFITLSSLKNTIKQTIERKKISIQPSSKSKNTMQHEKWNHQF